MKLFIINLIFLCTVLCISEAASVRQLGCNPDYEAEYLEESPNRNEGVKGLSHYEDLGVKGHSQHASRGIKGAPVKYVSAKEYSHHEPQGVKVAHAVKNVSGIKLRKRRLDDDEKKHPAKYFSGIKLHKQKHEENGEKRKKRFGGSWSVGRSGRRY
ncbi:unnamed protein product [Diabrotica balteata]|uniref:Secreted protein n=1 Tax=Diabrotica balteata TaxID=107213 RepID=A0A9P0DY58_DIABA|nr:unnamed protein product [Diabrotica balteata]